MTDSNIRVGHPALLSARSKLSYAGGTIEHLEPILKQFEQENRAHLFVEEGPQSSRIIMNVEQTPIIYALKVGDIIHSMSSALDHIATSILRHVENDDKDKTTYFPNARTKRLFYDDKKTNSHKIKTKLPEVWKIIERHEPWGDSDCGSLLWAVRALDNIDKHRLMLVVPSRATATLNMITPNQPGVNKYNLYQTDGWGDIPIAVVPSPAYLVETSVEMEMYLSERDIVDHQPLIPFLKQVHRQIYAMLWEIDSALPE